VDPRAMVRLEGLSNLKKIHLIGIRSRGLPACSIVPQPTTLPHAPILYYIIFEIMCIMMIIMMNSLIDDDGNDD
jgi:hypothetical protein